MDPSGLASCVPVAPVSPSPRLGTLCNSSEIPPPSCPLLPTLPREVLQGALGRRVGQWAPVPREPVQEQDLAGFPPAFATATTSPRVFCVLNPTCQLLAMQVPTLLLPDPVCWDLSLFLVSS